LQISHPDVAALAGQAIGNARKLAFSEFHPRQHAESPGDCQLVLTRPRAFPKKL
jgi:hypothetical protein